MKAMMLKMLKTMFVASFARPMFFALARFFARQTDTLIDDRIVEVTEHAVNGDIEKTREALLKTLAQVEIEYKRYKNA